MNLAIKKNLLSGTIIKLSKPLFNKTSQSVTVAPIKQSDEDLARAYQNGDEQAFQILLDRHHKPLYNFVLKFIGNKEVAEEAFQEVFLRVIRSIDTYKPTAKFTTWIYKIARNYCIDYSRKQKFRNHLSLDEPFANGTESLYNRVEDIQTDSEELSSTSQLETLLYKILGELNAEQKEVFLLRETQGLQFDEIAKITKTSSNTVKSRMRYALRTIQTKFEEYGIRKEDIKKYA